MCATSEPVRSARPPRLGRRGRAGRSLLKARARRGERLDPDRASFGSVRGPRARNLFVPKPSPVIEMLFPDRITRL
jgi:hypothetical protein